MSETYIWPQPASPDALVPIGGSIQHNTGVMVEAILNLGERAHTKIAILITEYLSYTDTVRVWEKVTGKKGLSFEVSDEVFEGMWGPYGAEMAAHFRWSEAYPNWHRIWASEVLTLKELGVEGKLIGHEDALREIKDEIA
jgi:hypothetical protein